MFDKTPISIIAIPERLFQTFPDIPCSRCLYKCENRLHTSLIGKGGKFELALS